jgi:hypothetical protein
LRVPLPILGGGTIAIEAKTGPKPQTVTLEITSKFWSGPVDVPAREAAEFAADLLAAATTATAVASRSPRIDVI